MTGIAIVKGSKRLGRKAVHIFRRWLIHDKRPQQDQRVMPKGESALCGSLIER